MTKQQAAEKYNEEYQAKLKTEVFPDDALPAQYDQWKHAALNFESVASIRQVYGISWEEYRRLLMKNRGYSLFEIAIINNTIEMRTPNELDRMIEENYYNVQEQIIGMNKLHVEISKPIHEAVARKIEIMSSHRGAFNEKPLTIVNGRGR